jgi:hypothetical protein
MSVESNFDLGVLIFEEDGFNLSLPIFFFFFGTSYHQVMGFTLFRAWLDIHHVSLQWKVISYYLTEEHENAPLCKYYSFT